MHADGRQLDDDADNEDSTDGSRDRRLGLGLNAESAQLDDASSGAVPASLYPCAARNMVVGSLRPGSRYQFNVVALNAAGCSASSEPSAVLLTETTTPGMPTRLSASQVEGGGKVVDVQWMPPECTGGLPLICYDVQVEALDGELVDHATVEATPRSSVSADGLYFSATFTNLRRGMQYRFRVVATNQLGSGEWTPFGATLQLSLTAPEPPLAARVTDVRSETVVLTWTDADDGGADMLGYLIEQVPSQLVQSDDLDWVGSYPAVADNDGLERDATSAFLDATDLRTRPNFVRHVKNFEGTQRVTLMRLSPNCTYMFRVCAVNESNFVGDWSTEQLIANTHSRMPDAPDEPKLVSASTELITLEWTEPSCDGGLRIVRYRRLDQAQ